MSGPGETPDGPPCAPWCDYRDDPDFADGNRGWWCMGPDMRSPLSISQPGDPSDFEDEGHDYVTVYPVRQPGQPDSVFVGHNVKEGLYLTPADADLVITHIQLAIAQIVSAQAVAR